MTPVFGDAYARQYDALYGDKDYQAECEAVERLLARHGTGPTVSVLDLGCGTGTHALLLADRGHAVTGVDVAPAMLELARAKSAQRPRPGAPRFVEGDIRTVELGQTFDVTLMMFAVLGYQTRNADVAAALRTVRAHLRPGGMFICDVWFGPAVLSLGPSDRVKVIDEPGGQLHRSASGRLDVMHHTCLVEFHTWRTRGGREVERTAEKHTMRYFHPLELDLFLAAAGMELCTICPVDNLDAVPGLDTWNVWVCARATS
jgi:SAM-dependent methyltransferase